MKHIPLLLALLILLCSFAFNGFQANTEATIAISANKVNVFYIGVDNPVSIAISGVPIEDTKVRISKGKMMEERGAGKYSIRVYEEGTTTIYLEGKAPNGKIVRDSSLFRVKRIPDPTARLSNKSGGKISLGFIKAQGGIIAPLLNLDIDASWKVLHYTVERIRKNEPSVLLEGTEGRFSHEVRALLEESQSRDIYLFYDIEVKGPDGFERRIQGMGFKIE